MNIVHIVWGLGIGGVESMLVDIANYQAQSHTVSIIVINDNAQDGTDISWLWDVDFDRFADPSIRSITVSGIRCHDMRLRLKYVGIHADLEADVKTAIEKRLKDGCGNLYVLVNYTALYRTHIILKEMEKGGKA